MNYLKLPLQFDANALKSDLGRVHASDWIRHYNTDNYEGEWSGVALRSVSGQAAQLYSMMAAPELFSDTEVLARCLYFQEVLAQFQCPLTAVRLLKLSAGSRILEHHDDRLAFAEGQARLHVPIVTDPAVDFYLDGEKVVMRAGECWYLNLTLPHRCDNKSNTDRVHLVIDCWVNEWLASLFRPAALTSIETSPN